MDFTRAALTAMAAATIAVPALAQPATQFEIDNLRAQQEAAQRRAVDLSNQLAAAEAQARADQAVAALQLQQRLPQTVPLPPYRQTPRVAAAASYPQIPDAALAASNQRVQAAARNRR
jgi:hypothetical protein